ncbi:YicC/YloC family endoribonuclease [Halobacillus sp. A5]|uniref:YicC/YloC family endoribonuclease n=1 Tax=Halobacillus sp. A5 TaxID=2880263 RepID=UPI0020A69AFC|nr:YicC/YloC family endoribonuclease [Halobacillus sp. A5]MCP3026179.1 YicC family protein [Halobacillus sp. A5]
MIRSMTGYGREELNVEGVKGTLEIRSVNHRFFDFSPKIPRSLLFMEDKLKKITGDVVKRGRIDCFLNLEGEGLTSLGLQVNEDLIRQYKEQLHILKGKYELTGEISIDMVAKLDHAFSITETPKLSSGLTSAVEKAAQRALEQLLSMRESEGEQLKVDLLQRLQSLESIVNLIEAKRDSVINEYKEKIVQRIENYTKEALTEDQQRVYQEVALLAEKGDISEEVTRLYSHITQFHTLLKQGGVVGRTLDFIVQEFHREINTIGSKSNDPELSNQVVKMKSEIEKIKEQVQNIE